MRILRQSFPLICALLVLWACIGVLTAMILRRDAGHFVYSLDDAYIHMAMAKQFCLHGVWGPTQYGYASASSAPLWTLLSAGIFKVFGVTESMLLVLNIVFASLVVLAAFIGFRGMMLPSWVSTLGLLAMLVIASISAHAFTGMEHLMQAVLTIVAVYLAALTLEEEHAPKRKGQSRHFLWLLVVTPALIVTRYELMFLVGVIGLLLLLRRMVLRAFLFGALAFIPMLIYGLISKAHGGWILPNPVLMKGSDPFWSVLPKRFSINMPMVILIVFAIIVVRSQYMRDRMFWKRTVLLPAIFGSCAFLHVVIASTGPLRRYQAYLFALGVFALVAGLQKLWPQRLSLQDVRRNAVAVAIVMCMLLPAVKTGAGIIRRTPQSTRNIYEQQYQMARFLRQYYQGQAVAANDIGAITYFADIRLLDMAGLASLDVAKAVIQDNSFGTKQIYNMATDHGVKIAIVYDSWYNPMGGVPIDWYKAGEWTIPNNVVCGDDTVSFYAVDEVEEAKLIRNLRDFTSELPPDVTQSGRYTE